MKNLQSILRALSITLTVSASCATIAAQELNESLVVEGEYTPTVRRQDKINMLPERLRYNLSPNDLKFAGSGVTTNSENDIYALPAIGWQNSRNIDTDKGYLDFGIGSYMNITGSAGWSFLNTQQSKAGVWLQHNSSSTFSPFDYQWDTPNEELPDKATRKLSDSKLGLYASHHFDAGTLDTQLSYRFARFNYYGVDRDIVTNYGKIPTQNLNNIDMQAEWSGKPIKNTINYSLSARYRHFSYHRYFTPTTAYKTQKENHFSIAGKMLMPWDSGSNIGIDVAGDLLIYTDPETTLSFPHMEDYGMISLSPYYRFIKENLIVGVGARIDLTANAKREYIESGITNNYSFFHISPNLRVDWKKNSVGLYIYLNGGTQLNTLASNSQLDYYQAPMLSGTIPVYSPIDMSMGVTVGQISGFSASVKFDYKISNNIPYAGCYVTRIDNHNSFSNPANADIDIKGFRIGLTADYKYGKMLEFDASAYFSPQDKEKGYFNGYDRPEWTADANFTINPWSTLKVNLGWQLRANRTLYDATLTPAEHHRPEVNTTYTPLEDINLINIGASYALLNERLTVWVNAENILGSEVYLNPAMPQEKFNIMAGVGFTF